MISTTSYRTKLMPLSRAASFARCLAANGAFRDVQVLESGRTKSQEAKWFVNYTPASIERHRAILQTSQDARAARAATEAGTYQFHLSDCGRYHYTVTAQGEVYETTTAHCDCPDAHYRLRGTGLRCKHSLALESHLEEAARELEIERQADEQREREAAEEPALTDLPPALEKLNGALAIIRANIERDFPTD